MLNNGVFFKENPTVICSSRTAMPLYSERKKVKGLVTSLYLWNAISDLSLLFFLAEGAWLTKSSIMWVGIGMMLSTSLEYSSSGQSSLFKLSVIFPELHEKACDCLQKTAAKMYLFPGLPLYAPRKKIRERKAWYT